MKTRHLGLTALVISTMMLWGCKETDQSQDPHSTYGTSHDGKLSDKAPLMADFDSDGCVSSVDLAILRKNWGLKATISGDANSDGRVNNADLSILLDAFDSCEPSDADFDGNGCVDEIDLETLKSNFGKVASISGDANEDRSVDNSDLNILLNEFDRCEGESPKALRADYNADGCVDNEDLNVVLDNFGQFATIPGDANGDRKVDDIDRVTLEKEWGQCAGSLRADFDKDGCVRSGDLNILLDHFSQTAIISGDSNDDGVVDEVDLAYVKYEWGTCQ